MATLFFPKTPILGKLTAFDFQKIAVMARYGLGEKDIAEMLGVGKWHVRTALKAVETARSVTGQEPEPDSLAKREVLAGMADQGGEMGRKIARAKADINAERLLLATAPCPVAGAICAKHPIPEIPANLNASRSIGLVAAAGDLFGGRLWAGLAGGIRQPDVMGAYLAHGAARQKTWLAIAAIGAKPLAGYSSLNGQAAQMVSHGHAADRIGALTVLDTIAGAALLEAQPDGPLKRYLVRLRASGAALGSELYRSYCQTPGQWAYVRNVATVCSNEEFSALSPYWKSGRALKDFIKKRANLAVNQLGFRKCF
jgi:hypothetical protein